jgi:hypothetical protein
MAPRLKILMSSGSKKGAQIYYPFLSKSPGKRIPSRFPNGAPMGRDTRLQGIFTPLLIYLLTYLSGSPVKTSLQVPLMESPVYDPPPDSRFPSDIQGLLSREMPVSQAFLNIFPRVPIKEPSPEALQRETLHS